MTTTVVKTIGTSSRDYSTLQAWEDACPADLVAVDQIWQGQCYNDSEFTGGMGAGGTTTDSTRYKELTTAAGQSFSDNASVQTNALRYNQANGVAVSVSGGYVTAISASDTYFKMSKIQVKVSSDQYVYDNNTGGTSHTLNKCIFQQSGSGSVVRMRGGTVSNSLLIKDTSSGSGYALRGAYGGATATNCTFVRPTTYSAAGAAVLTDGSWGATLKNCAIFGFTTDVSGTNFTATTCYTSDSSPSTGFTNVAYDTSTGSGFQNTASSTADFRIKSGSALLDVGTTDTTYAANDIAGTARPQGSAYDVGAWELVTSGGAKIISLAQVTETDTAQAVTVNPKRRLVAQITGAGTAQAITARKQRALAQVTETDTAQAITPLGAKIIPLAQVTETDTAQAVAYNPKRRLLGRVNETDQAQAITARKIKGFVQVTEADTAQAVTPNPKRRLLAQAVEADTAQAIAKAIKTRLLAQATETDVAQALAKIKRKALAQATETDTAQAVAVSPKRRMIGQASESDTAQAVTWQAPTLAPIAHPSADVSGTWSASTGTAKYAMIDEDVMDNADYIYATTVGAIQKMQLSPVANPGTTSGQVLSYAVWSPSGHGVTVRLLNRSDASLVASWAHPGPLPTTPPATQSAATHQSLTPTQIAAIINYAALDLEVEATN